MLDSLRAMMLKASPPPDNPPHQLQQAQQALEQAEQYLEHTRATTSEKLAERQVEQRKAELAAAEHAVKVAELQELEAQLTQALEQKAALHQCIKRQFESVLIDLQALDAIEERGMTLNSKAFTRAMDIKAPLKSSWRDPLLGGISTLISNWLKKLEGA